MFRVSGAFSLPSLLRQLFSVNLLSSSLSLCFKGQNRLVSWIVFAEVCLCFCWENSEICHCYCWENWACLLLWLLALGQLLCIQTWYRKWNIMEQVTRDSCFSLSWITGKSPENNCHVVTWAPVHNVTVNHRFTSCYSMIIFHWSKENFIGKPLWNNEL